MRDAARAMLFGVIALALPLAALFAFAFHDRYWAHRGCFNDLGRCWDPVTEMVYVEQAGVIWGGFTVISLLAAGLAWWGLRRLRA